MCSVLLQVVIRVRPPLSRELRGGLLRPYQCTTHVDPSGRIATISENLPAVLQVRGHEKAWPGRMAADDRQMHCCRCVKNMYAKLYLLALALLLLRVKCMYAGLCLLVLVL